MLLLAICAALFIASNAHDDWAKCEVTDDKKITTFDGQILDASNTRIPCNYHVVKQSKDIDAINELQVNAKGKGNNSRVHVVVCIHNIFLIDLEDIKVDSDEYKGKWEKNKVVTVGASKSTKITKENKYIRIVKDGHFEIRYYGRGKEQRQIYTIYVNDFYSGKLHGVCGNYNGDKADDMKPNGSKQVVSEKDIIEVFTALMMDNKQCYID